MKKFLYIVDSFPPVNNQISIRSLEFSKRLMSTDYRPIILTRNLTRRMPLDHSLLNEVPKQLKIYRTKVFELKRRYGLRTLGVKILSKIINVFFFIHWIPFAYIDGRKILKANLDIKLIYTSGPPFFNFLIAFLLHRKFKVPYIIEYRDPWQFSPYIGKKRLQNKLFEIFENKIIYFAKSIITISQALKSLYLRHFPEINEKNVYSIENGLIIKDLKNSYEFSPQKITLTFVGSLYGKRNISPLLEIISKLKLNHFFDDIDLKIKIFGKYNKLSLEKLANDYNIQDVIILGPYLTRSEIHRQVQKSTMAIHIGENVDYPTIAFKVWDYLSNRKKVLYLGREDSFTGNFLTKNDFGTIIPINDIKKGERKFKDLIKSIKNGSFNQQIELGKLQEYRWEEKFNKLMKCLKDSF
jgi:glycosyltransferase involved in cell wall biosynthesis